jgi:hypothetical protein
LTYSFFVSFCYMHQRGLPFDFSFFLHLRESLVFY